MARSLCRGTAVIRSLMLFLFSLVMILLCGLTTMSTFDAVVISMAWLRLIVCSCDTVIRRLGRFRFVKAVPPARMMTVWLLLIIVECMMLLQVILK